MVIIINEIVFFLINPCQSYHLVINFFFSFSLYDGTYLLYL